MGDSDPFDWSIDRVVYEMCHNPQAVWSQSNNAVQMPDPTTWEHILRENHIRGQILLEQIGHSTLKDDLNVHSFGQRCDILHAVECLRRLSPKYRLSRQPSLQSQTPDRLLVSAGYANPQVTGSYSSAYSRSPSLPVLPADELLLSRHYQDDGIPDLATSSITKQDLHIHNEQDIPLPQSERRSTMGLQSETMTEKAASMVVRDVPAVPGNSLAVATPILLEPQHRLPPSTNGIKAQEDNVPAVPTFQTSNTKQTDKISDSPRRIAPVLIAQLNPAATISPFGSASNLDNGAHKSRDHYLARDVISPDDMLCSSPDHDDKNFSAFNPQIAIGHRRHVAQRMKKYLRSRNIHDLEETEKKEDSFDYLLERYPPGPEDREILPLYGESGDEGDYDEETWEEMQKEQREKSQSKLAREMSVMQKDKAIDEAVEDLKWFWQAHEFPKVQVNGFRLWHTATRNRQVETQLTVFTSMVGRIEARIKNMRQYISGLAWHKSADVKYQCKSLEESLFQLEEYRYYLTVLQSNTPPIRPDPEAIKNRAAKPRADVAEDEEILESETDLSDFVIDDEDDEGLIFFDAENPVPMIDKTADQQIYAKPSPDVDMSDLLPDPHEGAENERSDQSSSAKRNEKSVPNTSTVEVAAQDDFMGASTDDEIPLPSQRKRKAREILSGPGQLTAETSTANEMSDKGDLLPHPGFFTLLDGTQGAPIVLDSSSPAPSERPAEDTQDSSSYESVRTPDINADRRTRLKLKVKPENESSSSAQMASSPIRIRVKPSLTDAEAIKGLEWKQLAGTRDRARILAKAFYEMDPVDAEKVQKYVERQHNPEDQITDALASIRDGQSDIDHAFRPHKGSRRTVRLLSLLYLSYACCQNLMDLNDVAPVDVDEAYNVQKTTIAPFFDHLRIIFSGSGWNDPPVKRGTKRRSDASENEPTDRPVARISSVSSLNLAADANLHKDETGPSSAKKRKRKVAESQDALNQQKNDRLRVQREEIRKRHMRERLAKMDVTGNNAERHAITFNDPVIYLDPHIGQRVKPHQVEGIAFMWREIITDAKQQGCLLAHTMGLGKTMQIVSLLVTIAHSANADDVGIRDQVPERFKQTKTLIMCPPSLIDNWLDELQMWCPPHASDFLGQFRAITSSTQLSSRLADIDNWAKNGGVLIISYEMFRSLVLNANANLDAEQHEKVQKALFESPNIIVADEAHKMKNAGSKITQLAQQFHSKSRIALTGSPLANNLEEYHTMVDWIAPNYLGNIVQFRSKYAEPISEGLYNDSTPEDRRISFRKLHVLKRDLDPKIHRADITAIEKDMPPKTEFFITLSLTGPQSQAYNKYVRFILQTNADNRTGNTRLWDWLATLSLLCNHPSCFFHKLTDRKLESTGRASPSTTGFIATTDDSQGTSLPTDVVISDNDLSPDMIREILEPIQSIDDQGNLDDPIHSNRSLIVWQIVEQSMQVGDKVLIFSHSIPSLNYLGTMLEAHGCRTCRIDGQTKISTRQGATKVFNKPDSMYHVFLISMRAGGLGLNLQGANRVIIFDFGFNPTWEEQAIGRAYRLGQAKSVFVYRFRAGGTFEDVMYNTAVFKTQLFSRVVDKKNYISQASRKASDYLYPIRPVERKKLDESMGKDPDVLDLIMRKTRCIQNIDLTETFQKEDSYTPTPAEVQLANEEYEDARLAREDPEAYASKLAAKRDRHQAAQSLRLPPTAPPGISLAGTQSSPALRTPTPLRLQPNAPGPSSVPAMRPSLASYNVSGMQKAISTVKTMPPFAHRAPIRYHVPHPVHQELIADGRPYTPAHQPFRHSSMGPQSTSRSLHGDDSEGAGADESTPGADDDGPENKPT